MAHPRVEQFRFARAEWVRGLRGLREEDGLRRLEPMNSISWMVGHLAWHERLLFVERAQGMKVEPVLDAVAFGMPASTPSLAAMWASWQRMTDLADPYPRRPDQRRTWPGPGRTTRGPTRRPSDRSSSASPTTTGTTSGRPRPCARCSATSGWPSSSARSSATRRTGPRTTDESAARERPGESGTQPGHDLATQPLERDGRPQQHRRAQPCRPARVAIAPGDRPPSGSNTCSSRRGDVEPDRRGLRGELRLERRERHLRSARPTAGRVGRHEELHDLVPKEHRIGQARRMDAVAGQALGHHGDDMRIGRRVHRSMSSAPNRPSRKPPTARAAAVDRTTDNARR